MWILWFSGNNFLEERMEGCGWIITAFPTPLQWRFFHPIKFSDFFLQIIVCLPLPMHSISGFKPNPPVLKPLQKSTSQTFSKWNQLRHEMEILKESEAVKTLKLFCIFVTFNFLAMAFLSPDFEDFNATHIQFRLKAPSVWRRFPWKAIQIFRARLVQLIKANASMRIWDLRWHFLELKIKP